MVSALRSMGLKASAAIAALALVGGCSSITDHRGYLMDEALVASVQPGIDNRESVRGTLGQPTLTSQFGDPVWYYISSQTEQAPFTTPDIYQHSVLEVKFDAAGNVVSAERTGIERIARINPDGDETPTLGRDRGFFDDLFGNIGRVGAGGLGGGGPGS